MLSARARRKGTAMDAELVVEPTPPRVGEPATITLSILRGELADDAKICWSIFVRDATADVMLPQYANQKSIRIDEWGPENHGTYYVDVDEGERKHRIAAQTVPPSLRVALSGGGFRASLLSLGALLYLVDSRQSHRIEDVASVSGGSMANAFVAARCDITSVTTDEFIDIVRQFFGKVTRRHLFVDVRLPEWLLGAAWLLPRVMLVVVVATAAVLVTSGWATWSLLGALVVAVIIALTLRGFVVERMLRRRLGVNGTLGQPRRRVTHAYCATDLVVGEPIYFLSTNAGGFVYARSRGVARFDGLPTRKAVRSSAAFPGAFLPKRLRLHPQRFKWVVEPHWRGVRHEGSVAYCADGGVANNMATQWHEENVPNDWPYRLIYGSELSDGVPWRPGREILQLAIDATQPLKPSSPRLFALPGVAEAKALARVMSVLYSNTVVPRRAAASWERSVLVDRALRTPDEEWSYFPMQRGAHRLVIIRPTDAPGEQLEMLVYSNSTVYGRPKAVELRALVTKSHLRPWLDDEAFARANQMPTTLFRRSRQEVRDALVAGYVGALALAHVYENLGVPPAFDQTVAKIREMV